MLIMLLLDKLIVFGCLLNLLVLEACTERIYALWLQVFAVIGWTVGPLTPLRGHMLKSVGLRLELAPARVGYYSHIGPAGGPT